MLLFASLAFARDVDLKVHDMKGVVTGEVTLELGEPGKEPLRFVCRDDGVAPDAIAGDRLYTSRAVGLAIDHGSVVVRADGRTWQGGFRFDDGSDPVLLVGLEDGGFAAASTREVMFVPQDRMPPPGPGGAPGAVGATGGMTVGVPGSGVPAGGGVPGSGVPDGGAPGGLTGGVPGGLPGGVPGDGGASAGGVGSPGGAQGGAVGGPGGDAALARKAPARAGLPAGMWLGWGIAAAALAGLGAVAWAGSARAQRVPPLVGAGGAAPARVTTAARGPLGAAPDRVDLFVGDVPAGVVAGLRVGDGRWTPDEIALAAARVRGEPRVVVTDGALVETDGDAFAALSSALAGTADLLWVEPSSR